MSQNDTRWTSVALNYRRSNTMDGYLCYFIKFWASKPRQIIFVRESTVSDSVAAAVSLSMHHPKK
jgi:hypothetical protein